MVTAVAPHLSETWTSPAEAECLVDRAKRGERPAFLALFQTHARCVYTLSLRATRNITAAENLTRDTFVEAFSSLDAVGDDEAFATLLHGCLAAKIMSNRAVAG